MKTETDIVQMFERDRETRILLVPDYPWSVKNQARMHTKNDLPPYRSSRDAMAQFPETVTAIGLTLHADRVVFFSAYGVSDLLQQRLRPTPSFQATARQVIYQQRLAEKQWVKNWPGVHEAENEATGLKNF